MDVGLHQHVQKSTRDNGVLDLVFSTDEGLIDEVVNFGKFDTSDHDMF